MATNPFSDKKNSAPKDMMAHPYFSQAFEGFYKNKFQTAEGRAWLRAKGWYDKDQANSVWALQDLQNKIRGSQAMAELYWEMYPEYYGNYDVVTKIGMGAPRVEFPNWDPRKGAYGGYPDPNRPPPAPPVPKGQTTPEDLEKRRKWQRQTLLTSAQGAEGFDDDENRRKQKRKRLLGVRSRGEV